VGCAPSALRGVMHTLERIILDTAAAWEQEGIARACSHFSGQASSSARCEVAICFNRFHRPAL
jgi:hypothetical protein